MKVNAMPRTVHRQYPKGVTSSVRAGAHTGGFTLIEMLVVLAITGVVFFLLLRPIISSLSLTQEAQSLATAQDSGRKASEILSQELSHADYVFSGLSHPFALNPGTATTGEDTYTNFLDIEIPANPSKLASGNSYTVAHVYGAKLDFASVEPNTTNGGGPYLIDPTSQQPVTLQTNASGSVSEQQAPTLVPIAPNTTLVRYFVGLKYPLIKGQPAHYSNDNIGLSITGQGSNTYILYRAQVSVYSGGVVNPNYFTNVADGLEETSGPNFAKDSATPEIDDPDFFRHVSTSDINWLDINHKTYSASQVFEHNNRFQSWIDAAKPVVTAPNIDMLDLPRNADGTIAYDPTTGIPSINTVGDPVSGDPGNLDLSGQPPTWPVANVTVSFSPAAYSADSPTPTATQDLTQGLTNNPTAGISYIPSAYQASHASWAPNYSIALYPYGYSSGAAGQQGSYFFAMQTFVSSASANGTDSPGDIIEYRVDGTAAAIPVYNITQGFAEPDALNGKGGPLYNYYVPFTVDADRGYINFATPAKAPAFGDQNNPYVTGGQWPPASGQWSSTSTSVPYFLFSGANLPSIDLGQAQETQNVDGATYETVLPPWSTGTPVSSGVTPTPFQTLSGIQIQNATVVPGTLRVLGPDNQAGPNNGYDTLYQTIGTSNVFAFNRLTNVLTLSPVYTIPLTGSNTNANPDPIAVSFSYQANLTFDDPADPPAAETFPTGQAPVAGNYAHPMTVLASYVSRDAINASIGIRVYRPSSALSDLATFPTTIAVGNANH